VIERRPHPFPNAVTGHYAIATFHRPANVDDVATLAQLAEGLIALSRTHPLIFPVHPRTRQRLETAGLLAALDRNDAITLTEPLGYADFMRCLFDAALVVTDSGGVQEETTILGVPCLTLRENTERPVTITHGTNQLVGTDPAKIADAWARVKHHPTATACPPLWDGQAAERIADILSRYWD
jgi:UDP-N-acetylglucosamine 2-epimerase (non-hydrolysing)